MSAHYYFQDFTRFEHLELFLANHIQSVVDRFVMSDKYNLVTRIRTTRRRVGFKKPHFLCEIRLDSPEFTTPVVVKKDGLNFYETATHVSKVLRKILRRHSSKKAQHGRRDYIKISKMLENQ